MDTYVAHFKCMKIPIPNEIYLLKDKSWLSQNISSNSVCYYDNVVSTKEGFCKYPIVIWIVINKKHWESAELRQDLLCYTAPDMSHQEGREAVKGRLE